MEMYVFPYPKGLLPLPTLSSRTGGKRASVGILNLYVLGMLNYA